jgi:hypothetical protein
MTGSPSSHQPSTRPPVSLGSGRPARSRGFAGATASASFVSGLTAVGGTCWSAGRDTVPRRSVWRAGGAHCGRLAPAVPAHA